MEAFSVGPFSYEPGKTRTVNGVPQREWALQYASSVVGAAWVAGPHAAVVEALADARAAATARLASDNAPDTLILRRWSDAQALDSIELSAWPGTLAGCIPDDSSEFWAEVVGTTHRMPVSLREWSALQRTHAAPPLAWIAGLLPDDVRTTDAAQWRAPTSWEIRHVVGEGSFTGVTGAAAAALVGVTPQNFRKYTARDGARGQQNMSFAMWHLLLHKLGAQSL